MYGHMLEDVDSIRVGEIAYGNKDVVIAHDDDTARSLNPDAYVEIFDGRTEPRMMADEVVIERVEVGRWLVNGVSFTSLCWHECHGGKKY